MKNKCFLKIFFLSMSILITGVLAPALCFSQEVKNALLIANNNYQGSIPSLAESVKKARDLKLALESIGFKCTIVENADRERMEDALFNFGEKCKTEGGIAFFHYGGHAVQMDGMNYLLPARTSLKSMGQVRGKCMNVNNLMENMKGDANIVVLDSCRNNPFGSGTRGGAKRGLAAIDTKIKNSIIVYSADSDEEAEDGVFTPILTQYITEPNVSITELLIKVRNEVLDKTGDQQEPAEYGKLLGQVYLAGRDSGIASKTLKGFLDVSTYTLASVMIDNEYAGEVEGFSQKRFEIASGTHRIKLKYKDGKTENTRVVIKSEKTEKLSFQYLSQEQIKLSVELASKYLKGIGGVAKDGAKAFEYAKIAADVGEAEGEYFVGYCFEAGLGVSKDEAEALKWYTKAQKKGNGDAMWKLGTFYHYGKGKIKQDYKEAQKLYEKAIKSNCSEEGIQNSRDGLKELKELIAKAKNKGKKEETEKAEEDEGWNDSAYVGYGISNPEVVVNSMHSGSIESIAYSPDGTYLATASRDKTIKLWEVETGRLLRTLTGHTKSVSAVCCSPDGKYIASGSDDETIKIWDARSGNCVKTFKGDGDICSVAYSPDGAYLASSSSKDKTIKLWDVASEICIKTFQGHTDYIASTAYSPDVAYLASGSKDKTIKIWDIKSGNCVKTFEGRKGDILSVAYSPDGTYLASASKDKAIKIWDVATNSCVKTLIGDSYSVDVVVYSPNGKYLASSGLDGVKLWEVSKNRYKKIGKRGVVAYSPDGAYLSSAYSEITICKVPSGKCIKNICRSSYSVSSVTYDPKGEYIISSSSGGTKVWNALKGEYVKKIRGSDYVVYSPDGKYSVGISGSDVYLQKVETGERIKEFKGHTERVNSVCYSATGTYLASASDDKTVKIWNVETGKCIATLTGHTEKVNTVIALNYEWWFVSVSSDNTIKRWKVCIWEDDSFECTATYYGHTGGINSIAHSPDISYIASGSSDNTIKILSDYTLTCKKTLTGHTGSVNSVCYSPDRTYLISGSNDGTIKFWNASTGELLATMVNLKDDEWLTYTPEGFFAGSKWAVKNLVHIVDGMQTVSIDQMFDFFYRPDLVSAKLRGEDIPQLRY